MTNSLVISILLIVSLTIQDDTITQRPYFPFKEPMVPWTELPEEAPSDDFKLPDIDPPFYIEEPWRQDLEEIEEPEVHSKRSSKSKSTYPGLVKVHIVEAARKGVINCTGAFINPEWVITTATCFHKDMESYSYYVKVCGNITDAANLIPCTNSFIGEKIVFLGYPSYNNLAFVKMRKAKKNTNIINRNQTEEANSNSTMEDGKCGVVKKQKQEEMVNCTIVGFRNHEVIDLHLAYRTSCKPGYFCMDDPSGLSCDLQTGSLLICMNVTKGIYSHHHSMSCGNPHGEHDMPAEEEYYAMLFFLDLESYQDVIEEILSDKNNKPEDSH